MALTFKEYLIEDRITDKLDDIKQRLEGDEEEEKADTPAKQDRKFHIDRNRHGKMAPKARHQPSGEPEDQNPEGMKTAGGPTFSG